MKHFGHKYLKTRHYFYALLGFVIDFQLAHNFCENHDKFVRGEWLKYNWKAKIVIGGLKDVDINKPRQFEKYIISGQNVEFTDESSCSAFWVRRLYWCEKH